MFERTLFNALWARIGAQGDVGAFALAELPDPLSWTRRTAWATDLFGMPGGGRVVSEGGFWKPIRPLVVASMAAPASNVTLQPLVHGTTLMMTGTMSAQRTVTLGTGSGFAVPYPGYRQRTVRKAGGLFSLLVNGVGLSLNGWVDHEWDGTAWVQTASGGLL